MARRGGPQLILGPILRHVDGSKASLWVQTSGPCEVEILGHAQPTFEVEGHHFALLQVSGLEPGESTPYEVELDGERVWPEQGSELPPSTIRPHQKGEELKLIFGSCRVSLPHQPPYVLSQSDHPDAHGIDALRTLALRLIRDRERTPDCLLMLGDQVYADDLSPAMLEVTRSREDSSAPEDELADFDEYCLAYREAWGEPVVRWLLSTVPTAMIFDDHEINAQWKISADWQRKLQASDWYERRISGGLMAYWIYQHLGNLSVDDLPDHELLEQVRKVGREGDAGPLLRREMLDADSQPDHSRWSYRRDLGASRLIVIDSRAGRVLEPGKRRMIARGEWEWIAEQAQGDFEHLLLASSVPFFLTPGLHHGEAFDAELTDGRGGRVSRAIGEKLRQTAVMDHWASFPASFNDLCELLGAVASGRHGEGSAPKAIVMLSGDVHHCYLARVSLDGEPDADSAIWQAVCSAYRKDLAPREKRTMRVGTSRIGERIARRLARMARAPKPSASWELTDGPSYDNQVGTLYLEPDKARVTIETTSGSDWRDPDLSEVFERDLLS